MKSFSVHLTFGGNCEEAINFYKNCFGGEILAKSTYGESPMPTSDDFKSKIMHIEFKFDNVLVMAADGMPGFSPNISNNIALTIDFTDAREEETVFNKLANGGKVTMPLQDTFWNAKFGMITDKYGISWMLNYSKPKLDE